MCFIVQWHNFHTFFILNLTVGELNKVEDYTPRLPKCKSSFYLLQICLCVCVCVCVCVCGDIYTFTADKGAIFNSITSTQNGQHFLLSI